MANMQLQVIVASLPATKERVHAMHKRMNLKYPVTNEYICQECDGKCFVSEGTHKGASRKAKEDGAILVIMCETCAEESMKGGEIHIPQEQLDEIKEVIN